MLSVVWLVVSVSRGEILTAAVVAGGAVFSFGMVSLLLRVAAKRVSIRVNVRDGVMLRPDRRVDVSLMLATAGLWGAMALYAICAPLGLVEVSLPYGDRAFSVWIAVAGVLIGLPSLKQIFVKRGMSYVLLSPKGFELGSTVGSTAYAWGELADVSDTPTGRARPISTGTTYLTMLSGRTRTLPSDWYTPGGSELRKLLRFYWQHPENRDELTDRRTVARLGNLL
ncbi:hypothetical protein [Mycobacterium sp. 236(2023)]|uniref:hypothetical protein n=1 Tax=Mycobacterium sp. 236(2023) TaxID=3038163 RepID=UPI0024155DD1|nr:hypothetical protein [Mycobacterium sp. 236(2023)]MDG4665531.1 hypothetical protein [Mycobacterium sp. 236(2023)]